MRPSPPCSSALPALGCQRVPCKARFHASGQHNPLQSALAGPHVGVWSAVGGAARLGDLSQQAQCATPACRDSAQRPRRARAPRRAGGRAGSAPTCACSCRTRARRWARCGASWRSSCRPSTASSGSPSTTRAPARASPPPRSRPAAARPRPQHGRSGGAGSLLLCKLKDTAAVPGSSPAGPAWRGCGGLVQPCSPATLRAAANTVRGAGGPALHVDGGVLGHPGVRFRIPELSSPPVRERHLPLLHAPVRRAPPRLRNPTLCQHPVMFRICATLSVLLFFMRWTHAPPCAPMRRPPQPTARRAGATGSRDAHMCRRPACSLCLAKMPLQGCLGWWMV